MSQALSRQRNALRNLSILATLLLLVGCVSDPPSDTARDDKDNIGDYGSADGWNPANSPEWLSNSTFEYNVDVLHKRSAEGEVANLEGGVENLTIPGDYWATYRDNINVQWRDGEDSPAEKYAKAFGIDVELFTRAVSSRYGLLSKNFNRCDPTSPSPCQGELDSSSECSPLPENYMTDEDREPGNGGVCVPTWWGVCNGWAPYALLERMPTKEVEYNGVTFYPGDLNALMSVMYYGVEKDIIGTKCRGSEASLEYDEYGRVINSECRDVNPGSLHIAAVNLLAMQKRGFVVDRVWDDQVWNQPVSGYKLARFEEVTSAEAQSLVTGESVSLQGLIEETSLANGQTVENSFSVDSDGEVALSLAGTGDADLYVRVSTAPTESVYDCRPYASSSNEVCRVNATGGQTIYWMVVGYGDESVVTLSRTGSGEADDVYAFNGRARRFFDVTMDMYWVQEGHPRTSIDDPVGFVNEHTKTDTYTYVLEADGDGNIIGGEYTGESMRFHSDFLWVPTGTPDYQILDPRNGIRIDYENIRMLHDMATSE